MYLEPSFHACSTSNQLGGSTVLVTPRLNPASAKLETLNISIENAIVQHGGRKSVCLSNTPQRQSSLAEYHIV